MRARQRLIFWSGDLDGDLVATLRVLSEDKELTTRWGIVWESAATSWAFFGNTGNGIVNDANVGGRDDTIAACMAVREPVDER